MADINKNNLLYVPKIEPERNYKSDGRIPKENPTPTPFPEEPTTDTPRDTYNDLAEVQELITLTGVPSLQFFNETIERLKKRLIVAFPTGEPPKKQSGTEEPVPHVPPVDPHTEEPGHKPEKKEKKTKVITEPPEVKMPFIPYDPGRNIPTNQETLHPWHVDREYGPDVHIITEPPEHEHVIIDTFEPPPKKPPKEGGGDIEEHRIHTIAEEVDTPVVKPIEVPNMFPNITNVVLNVVPPRSLVQIIQDNYARDTINLQNFYLQKLQLILQKYFQEMLTVMAECNVDDIDKLTQDFDGEYVTVGDPNMRHLRDSVCRSQIMRDQKERFIQKMFNVDNTMLHMNRWHVAEQEREAYYAESYGDSGSFLDSHANAILRDCRTQYDAAYNQSVYDMYKYLNSSCEALGDVLEMTSKEAQAKGQMLKKGVDIYKNKAVEEQKAEDKRHADELKELQAQREANKDAKPMSMSGGKLSDKSHISLAESNTANLSGYNSSGGASGGGTGGGTCSSAQLEKAVQTAIQLGNQGLSYEWGAEGPSSFDCTGFVSYCFNQAGFPIPVCHGDAFDNAFLSAGFEQIPFSGGDCSQLQRGDVLSNSHHVELYVGGGQQAGAHSSASGVSVTDFWTEYSWECIFRYKG